MPAEKLLTLMGLFMGTVCITLFLNSIDWGEEHKMSDGIAGFMHLLAGYVLTSLIWVFGSVIIQVLS